jgi:peptidoglycan/LPS O-acetylase OafA/YrhL
MRHITALDGIRAIAVLAVFAQHAGVPGTPGAGVAVDVFFVLSGFLITGLLLDEMARSDRIDVRAFYWRRFLRLTPALALTLAAYAIVAPHDLGSVLIGLFYLNDYARAFFVEAGPLSHMWSLAVEEHFYLIWPIALLALCRLPPRTLIPLLLALYLAATAHRGVASWMQGYDPAYFRFDTRLSGLILGSLLAVLLRTDWSRDKVTLGAIALGLGVAGGFALVSGQTSLTLGIAVAEATALRVILTVVEEKEPSALTRVLSLPALVYVGRISYGLYLFHYPATFVLRDEMGLNWMLVTALTLPASLAAAALSYHFIERPILDRARASRATNAAPKALPRRLATVGFGRVVARGSGV